MTQNYLKKLINTNKEGLLLIVLVLNVYLFKLPNN